ncbi:hypothetical protein GTQ43_37625, partial [Nostoc sp. KVJ3]|uniref:hypothetical protein n=1 Tax=Nostoc sp. KVJ3 TaxID=457945 RepID=UPI002237C85B
MWHAVQPLAEFVLGTMYQFLYDNGGSIRALLKPLQLTQKEEVLWERTLPNSAAFKLGRTLGGGAAIVQGIAEFLTGSIAEVGGGGLCITGIGCPGGVVAIATGAILQSHGAATAIFSAGEEGKLLRDLLSPNRMESSSNNPLEGQNFYVPNPKDNTTLSSIREELSSENILSDQKIDEGGFGTVYKIPEHKDLVIKVPTQSQGGQNNQLIQEAKNLYELTKKNYPTVYKGLIEWVDSNGISRQ